MYTYTYMYNIYLNGHITSINKKKTLPTKSPKDGFIPWISLVFSEVVATQSFVTKTMTEQGKK